MGLNLLLGLLMAVRYSPVRLWPHRRIDLFSLHRWTAYVAVALVLMHPAVLLFLEAHRFSLPQVLWPVHSYLQPKLNLAGAGALYLLVIVLVSSLWRVRLGRKVWRNLHWLVYPAAVLALVHSFLTDPELKDGRPDLLDGGKVFVIVAGVVIVAASSGRFFLRKTGFRPRS